MSRLQHVTVEIHARDAEAEIAFWGVLGFTPVPVPPTLSGATWLEAEDGLQIHLAHRADPVVPPLAHPAVVVDDFDAVVAGLGGAFEERTPHWGGRRGYATSPAGHTVEVMSVAP